MMFKGFYGVEQKLLKLYTLLFFLLWQNICMNATSANKKAVESILQCRFFNDY